MKACGRDACGVKTHQFETESKGGLFGETVSIRVHFREVQSSSFDGMYGHVNIHLKMVLNYSSGRQLSTVASTLAKVHISAALSGEHISLPELSCSQAAFAIFTVFFLQKPAFWERFFLFFSVIDVFSPKSCARKVSRET